RRRWHYLAPVLLFAACSSSSPAGSPPAGGNTGSGGGAGSGGGTSGGGDPTVDTNHNPFGGAQFYVNPDYVREVESSISMDAADAPLLAKMKTFPTAIWLDSIAKV